MNDVSRVEKVYLAAVEQLDPALRAKYLDAACGGDADFRRRVEELLDAEPKVGRFLEQPVNLNPTGIYQSKTLPLASAVTVGDRIGPYKLLERIGEGGMGEVWVADQQEPIKRRVALKLIKPGMDSRSVLGRFEAERQALAVMDHPNIAKVLDAGTTTEGRPYFVMELVKGTTITEFADARKLTPKQRLELFVPVCQAIQHAHMKGIIHRDIKPSNVLVELHDDRLVPKVIDFGVAKAVGQQLTEKTIYTGFGALVGTPTYMAPEQATFNAIDIDTRADVYALGVVLYELLAGSPPIESERLKKAALDEVLRIVRVEEPPRPSQRLSTSHMKASIAATRGGEPLKLSQLMRGELDWIVMKALEKDRTRRYETAIGFAADIQRYLVGEQVQAVPPSLGYRLRKAYRRNRAAVLVGTAFTLLLMSGVAVTSVLAIQARRAEKLADENMKQAVYNQAIANAARDEAIKSGNALAETTWAYKSLAVEAAVSANSARIDADLLEYKSDGRVGLLRMSRPLKDSVGPIPLPGRPNSTTTQNFPNDPEFVKLREFQAAAVIAAGQEFVPLVPPFVTPDETSVTASPDGRLCIGGTELTGLELLSIPSMKKVGTLREDAERVLKYGFSPDGKTIYTQDSDSIVRFWNTDGTLRAKTPLRPERFIYPAGMTLEEIRSTAELANPILVSDGVALLRSEQRVGVKSGRNMIDLEGKQGIAGPNELYSTRTGKLLRQLDHPGSQMRGWQISLDNRWLIYVEEPEKDVSQVVIVTTADGRELARLDHPSHLGTLYYEVSPTSKWILTYHNGSDAKTGTKRIRLWDTSTWEFVDHLLPIGFSIEIGNSLSFISDEIIGRFWHLLNSEVEECIFHIGQSQPWISLSSVGLCNDRNEPIITGELDGTLLRTGRTLFDAKKLQRIKPLTGRKYAAELAKLAPDQRFFGGLDTVTEKDIPVAIEGTYFAGFGRVAFRTAPLFDPELCILPDPKHLNIQPELLELWAQVVVGGELGADGTLELWDHPTWAAKQRVLAAAKPHYADFPFPGWVAAQPHLWHRVRANNLRDSKERNEQMEQWQRLTGLTRPDLKPDTWRTPELAPTSDKPN